jgi:hypothetical protein
MKNRRFTTFTTFTTPTPPPTTKYDDWKKSNSSVYRRR